MIFLVVNFGLVLREVDCNYKDVGAGFAGEEGDREIRLVLWWDVNGLNSWVGVLVNREYGASRAAFGLFVVERWVVYQFVVFECMSPD